MRSLHWILAATALIACSSAAQAKNIRVHYPSTEAGLERQIRTNLAAAQSGRKYLIKRSVTHLVIPKHRGWFAEVFGIENSQPVADEYERYYRRGGSVELQQMFIQAVAKGQTEIEIDVVISPRDRGARGLQKRALRAMHVRHTLYTVTLTRPGENVGTKLWSFVYVDGAFRYTGRMKALTEVPVGNHRRGVNTKPIHIDGEKIRQRIQWRRQP